MTLIGAGSGSISSILGNSSLTVNSTGIWTLAGVNTFTGATSISSGTVLYTNGTGFGTNSAITVAAGATAQVQGGITGGAEALTISGAGAAGRDGRLGKHRRNERFRRLDHPGAGATISVDAGTLNLTNTGITAGAGFNLTLAGAGNGSLAGIVGTTTGSLIKNGTGTGRSRATIPTRDQLQSTAGAGDQRQPDSEHGAVTVAGGATLQGNGTIGGNVTVK